MRVQDRLDDGLEPNAALHQLVPARDLTPAGKGHLVRDPDLRQEAGGIEPGKNPCVDLVGPSFSAIQSPSTSR